MDDVPQAVTARINELKALGWTTQAIADALGVARMTVYRWLGSGPPPEHPQMTLLALHHRLFDLKPPKKRRYPKNRASRLRPAAGATPELEAD